MDKNKANVPKIRFPGFTDPWEQRKLGEYGKFYYGHSAPKWSVTEDAETPCVRYGELYTKFGCKIDKVYSYTNMPKEKLVFSKGKEILIPRVGEDPFDYNHCTWLSLAGVAIGEMISVYNTNQNPLFTAIMFNATLREEFAKRVEGGSVTNLYYEKLKNINVSFPRMKEQEKIATFFENLDNLIILHQRKLNHLQDKKKGLLQKMFPKNGEAFPELRFPGFTDSWEQRKFEDFTKLSQGLQISISKRYTENVDGSKYFYITNEFLNPKSDKKYYIKNPPKNVVATKDDILMTRTGNTGKIVTNVSGAYHNNFFKIDFNHSKYDKMFLYYILNTVCMQKEILSRAGTSTIPDLNHSEFYTIKVMLPSYEEQKKIGDFLKQFDNLITLHQRKLNHLQEQKKALLQQMFV